MPGVGFVVLSRKTLDSWLIVQTSTTFHVAIWLLLRARWQHEPLAVRLNVIVARGQLLIRTKAIAEQLDMDRTSVQRAMDILRGHQFCTWHRVGNLGLLITVCKYDLYQSTVVDTAQPVQQPMRQPARQPARQPKPSYPYSPETREPGNKKNTKRASSDQRKKTVGKPSGTTRRPRKAWLQRFDDFWELYPRDDEPERAQRAWNKLCPVWEGLIDTTFDTIVERLKEKQERYIRSNKGREPEPFYQFFPYASNFLLAIDPTKPPKRRRASKPQAQDSDERPGRTGYPVIDWRFAREKAFTAALIDKAHLDRSNRSHHDAIRCALRTASKTLACVSEIPADDPDTPAPDDWQPDAGMLMRAWKILVERFPDIEKKGRLT